MYEILFRFVHVWHFCCTMSRGLLFIGQCRFSSFNLCYIKAALSFSSANSPAGYIRVVCCVIEVVIRRLQWRRYWGEVVPFSQWTPCLAHVQRRFCTVSSGNVGRTGVRHRHSVSVHRETTSPVTSRLQQPGKFPCHTATKLLNCCKRGGV